MKGEKLTVPTGQILYIVVKKSDPEAYWWQGVYSSGPNWKYTDGITNIFKFLYDHKDNGLMTYDRARFILTNDLGVLSAKWAASMGDVAKFFA